MDLVPGRLRLARPAGPPPRAAASPPPRTAASPPPRTAASPPPRAAASPPPGAAAELHTALLEWYAVHARDLPWRRPGTSAWGVLVSEVMLQQTPVSRVVPAYGAWLDRWPDAKALAADPPAEAIRQWGRLGYPRRALRLHAAAHAIVDRHAGVVPEEYEELRALPGVGEYTAAAVASFAFGARHAVLDTNVRRVLARVATGEAQPRPSLTKVERRLADALLPAAHLAPRWAVATMELGATVCTARRPACDRCPVSAVCSWRRAGRPAAEQATRAQSYNGTDRQARGALLALVRDNTEPVRPAQLATAWPKLEQRERALAGLVVDGLVELASDGRVELPGARR